MKQLQSGRRVFFAMELKRFQSFMIFDYCYPSQAKLLEEASLTWAIVEMVGLASYCNYFVEGQGAEKPPVKEGVKDGSE